MSNPTLTPQSIASGFQATPFNRLELLILRAHSNGLSADNISRQYGKTGAQDIRALLDRAIRTFHAHQRIDGAIALRAINTHDETAIRRAFWAINELERLTPPEPRLDDPVTHWFVPALARRLERNDITTLRDLCDRINERGAGFYRPLPGIGRKAASALLRWAVQNNDRLGYPFRDVIVSPALPVTTDRKLILPGTLPIPLEQVELTPQMDGRHGINRAPLLRNRLAVDNDLQAIQTWLSLYKTQPHTYRAYRREAERLLLWCVIERSKPLSSLTVEDCQAYKDFLGDPKPCVGAINYWRGVRMARSNPLWRPFEKALSPRSIAYALTVLKTLFEWLTRQGYLEVNLFDALPRTNTPTRLLVERALPKAAWDALINWLDTQCTDHTMHVAYVAALLAGDVGLRRHEIALLRRDHLVFDEFWELRFTGKGNRYRSVPVSDRCMAAIRSYYQNHKQTGLDNVLSDTPLIYPEKRPCAAPEKPQAGYSDGSIWRILKQAFKRFHAENGCIENVDICRLYPHALRHTFGVQAVRAGVDIDVVSQCLGHASLSTTTIYTQGDRKRRKEQLSKMHG